MMLDERSLAANSGKRRASALAGTMALVEEVTQLIALLGAGLFAGGALYASVAEHPGRVAAGTGVAVSQLPHSYKRAAPLQGGLAIVALAAGVIAAFASGSWEWALAGGCVGAAVPITLVLISPVNERLMSQSDRLTDAEATSLLARWARLHALRTGFGVTGFAVASVLSAGS
jgi:Domain of unknown function (DUF1772)